MSKRSHLKRLNAPKSWPLKRKGLIFITRALPGPHTMHTSVPLSIMIRDMLHYATSSREARNILQNRMVLINGIRRKSAKFPVGLFDVIEIQDTKEFFRVIISTKGIIGILPIDKADAAVRLCKVANKSKVNGKTQLNLSEGTNILVDKDEYKTGDSIVLKTGEKKAIQKKLLFAKGATIFLTGGSNIGRVGVIEEIQPKKVLYTIGDHTFETSKKYAFVIGEGTPLIKLEK